jgi:hypothetical protein
MHLDDDSIHTSLLIRRKQLDQSSFFPVKSVTIAVNDLFEFEGQPVPAQRPGDARLQLVCLMFSIIKRISPEHDLDLNLKEPFLAAQEIFQQQDSSGARRVAISWPSSAARFKFCNHLLICLRPQPNDDPTCSEYQPSQVESNRLVGGFY